MNRYKRPDIYRKYMLAMMILTLVASISSLIMSVKNSSAIENKKTIIVCRVVEKAYNENFVLCEDNKNV